MIYKIEAKFYDEDASQPQIDTYYAFLKKYSAAGIAHRGTRTSSINIETKKSLTRKILEQDLVGIEILSFKKLH
jgi:hypothetical protein